MLMELNLANVGQSSATDASNVYIMITDASLRMDL